MTTANMAFVIRRVVILLFLTGAASLTGCGVPAADGPAGTFGLDLDLPATARSDGAVIFLVDGMNADLFGKMLQAGELPAIKKYFVDRGLYAPRAVANVPSVTLANLTSVVTGRFPGHHGITGVNWFDRTSLVWRNYETIAQKNTLDGDYTAANIYEQFPYRTTFSVFFQPHRGCTKFIENWTSAGAPFFFGWYEFVDRLTLSRFNIVAEVARKRDAWPAVTTVYMLAPDFHAYASGVGSRQYRNALRHTDRQIGRFCGDLARAGLLDKLDLVLVSDHGMGKVARHFPLDNFLRKRAGIDLAGRHLWENTSFEKRLAYYRRFPAVTYGSGDRYWAICLRKPIRPGAGKTVSYRPWPVRPSREDLMSYPSRNDTDGIDLIKLLVSQEAVDVVAFSAGANRVRVALAAGKVEFRQPGGAGTAISYHSIAGNDPLRWRGKVADALLTGQPADARRWLAQTIATDYPDLPAQILAYFHARRAGDLAVFAAPGWDFRNHNRAGHGGLRPADMFVPLLIAGPGVRQGRVELARSVDIVPTLLELLGKPVPAGLDGQPLVHRSGR